jgi:adenosylhomocysteine nucleosidase
LAASYRQIMTGDDPWLAPSLQVPIVMLTALNMEYNEVRARLTGIRVRTHPAGTRFEVGRLGSDGCPVALALVGKGNQHAAVLAERAVAEFSPQVVLFAGIAGALWPHIGLGDVVVATHVYAYHGGTSEDDGLKARPRVWEVSHRSEQIAQHLARDGAWAARLPPGSAAPAVHFGPIAAGEVVQDSAISAQARWIRQHYHDALAIETEAAGVAQACQLNDSLPVMVVRGISDRADGSKVRCDDAGWQRTAAAHAAAFSTALATALVREHVPGTARAGEGGNRTPVPGGTTNIVTGSARVVIQAGQVFGGIEIR